MSRTRSYLKSFHTWGLLVLIVAIGLSIRLHDLDRRSITHPEVYVPRIEFAPYARYPPPRHTVSAIVSGTYDYDNHPPGYYLFMWFWTGIFGTGLFWIRLPSALAGTATIVLLYKMARHRHGNAVSLVAASLLALHGFHVFWSQQARMWVFLPFFAVISVVLLQSLNQRWSDKTAALYLLTVTSGLWFDYYFWPFMAAQIAWQLWRSCGEKGFPHILGLQSLSLVLATPMLIFLQTQFHKNEYISDDAIMKFREVLGLCGLINSENLLGTVVNPDSLFLLALEIPVGLLLIAGALSGPPDHEGTAARSAGPRLPIVAAIACSTLATLFCLVYSKAFEDSRILLPTAVLPWILVGAGYLAARTWRVWSRPIRAARNAPGFRHLPADEMAAHFVITLIILFFLSLGVRCLATRGFLVLVPFCIVLFTRGMWRLLSGLTARSAAVAVLALLCAGSVYLYSRTPTGARDYQSLAIQMEPHLRETDILFIPVSWCTQPISYYLSPDEYSIRYPGKIAHRLEDRNIVRFWVIVFVDSGDAEQHLINMSQIITPQGYREILRCDVDRGAAVLWQKNSAPARPSP